ncbi:unnamed protein product [Pedinophyceae sp. YPF-701]|nr:unnamed protein product [Pedinophyceae sp. YPF-701]
MATHAMKAKAAGGAGPGPASGDSGSRDDSRWRHLIEKRRESGSGRPSGVRSDQKTPPVHHGAVTASAGDAQPSGLPGSQHGVTSTQMKLRRLETLRTSESGIIRSTSMQSGSQLDRHSGDLAGPSPMAGVPAPGGPFPTSPSPRKTPPEGQAVAPTVVNRARAFTESQFGSDAILAPTYRDSGYRPSPSGKRGSLELPRPALKPSVVAREGSLTGNDPRRAKDSVRERTASAFGDSGRARDAGKDKDLSKTLDALQRMRTLGKPRSKPSPSPLTQSRTKSSSGQESTAADASSVPRSNSNNAAPTARGSAGAKDKEKAAEDVAAAAAPEKSLKLQQAMGGRMTNLLPTPLGIFSQHDLPPWVEAANRGVRVAPGTSLMRMTSGILVDGLELDGLARLWLHVLDTVSGSEGYVMCQDVVRMISSNAMRSDVEISSQTVTTMATGLMKAHSNTTRVGIGDLIVAGFPSAKATETPVLIQLCMMSLFSGVDCRLSPYKQRLVAELFYQIDLRNRGIVLFSEIEALMRMTKDWQREHMRVLIMQLTALPNHETGFMNVRGFLKWFEDHHLKPVSVDDPSNITVDDLVGILGGPPLSARDADASEKERANYEASRRAARARIQHAMSAVNPGRNEEIRSQVLEEDSERDKTAPVY